MKFLISPPENSPDVLFSYDTTFLAIQPSEKSENTLNSISVNEVNIDIDLSGKLLFPNGYCPLTNAKRASLSQFGFIRRDIIVENNDFVPGITYKVLETDNIYLDIENGFILLGDLDENSKVEKIEFCQNCFLTLDKGEIMSLMVRVENLENAIRQLD
jgi:hypothetical protein